MPDDSRPCGDKPTHADDGPQRADAQRNRQRLLDAALEVVGTQGTDVPISDITERAGVGRSTFFRHFRTKEELLAATAANQFQQLADLAAAKGEQHADPGEALCEYMIHGSSIYARHQAFFEAMPWPFPHLPMIRPANDALNDAVTRLLSRAQAAGAVRTDLVPTDIRLLMVGLTKLNEQLRLRYPEAWRRYLELLFDAFRPAAAVGSSLDDVAPAPETWHV